MRRTVLGSATKFWPRSRRGARPRLVRSSRTVGREWVIDEGSSTAASARSSPDLDVDRRAGQVGDLAEAVGVHDELVLRGVRRPQRGPALDRSAVVDVDDPDVGTGLDAAVQARVDAPDRPAVDRRRRVDERVGAVCRWRSRTCSARGGQRRAGEVAGVDRRPSGRSARCRPRRRRAGTILGRQADGRDVRPAPAAPAASWLASHTAGSATIVNALASTSRRRSLSSNLRVRSRVVGPASGPTHWRTKTLGTCGAERKLGRSGTPVTGQRDRGVRRSRPKAASAAARVASRTVSTGDAVDLGEAGADERHPRRAVGPAAVRDGRQVRAVGLDERPRQRHERRGRAHLGRALERDDAGEADGRAAVEAAPGLVGPAGEAVEDRARPARPRRRGCRTCRPTPRGCGSRAAGRAGGPWRSGRRTPRAGRRAASGRSGSRARTPRRRRPLRAVEQVGDGVDAVRWRRGGAARPWRGRRRARRRWPARPATTPGRTRP